MAPNKTATMILKVDLDCPRCYKKIRKTLCKLQDQENIKAIAYDEKKKTVTISGPFCPQKLFRILCCKACDCILEMEILKEPQADNKPTTGPPTGATKARDTPDQGTAKSSPKPESTKTAPAPGDAQPPVPPASAPAAPAPPPAPPVYAPIMSICLAGHVCRCNRASPCRPCQWGLDGGHRPCSCGCGGEYRPCRCGCGRGYVWMSGDPAAHGGPGYELDHYRPCQVTICEEGPTTCVIM